MKSLDDVLRSFSGLRWRSQLDSDGHGTAYAVLGGDRESGDLYVLAAIQNGVAPLHRHGSGGPYGERIGTFAGELFDRDDEGNPVTVGPSDLLLHGPGTVHAPRAEFWFGFYHQPRGSVLVRDLETDSRPRA